MAIRQSNVDSTVRSGHGGGYMPFTPAEIGLADEFVHSGTGVIGELGWTTTGGNTAAVSGSLLHPGVLDFQTAALGPTIVALRPSETLLMSVDNIQRVATIMRTRTIPTTVSVRFGFGTDPVALGETGQGVYFSQLTGTSANWRAITRDGAGVTTTVTNVPIVTDNWALFEIIRSGSNWDFYINGAHKATHTTNLLTAAAVSPFYALEHTLLINCQIEVDRYEFRSTALGNRFT